MINPVSFYQFLLSQGIENYVGVPDSLLKEICACINEMSSSERHTIAANEGAAVGLAVGSYLASRKPSLVYMQNSGFGNCVNPLLSIADPKVYSIPMVLLIGWRGEPGVSDEPQHVKQGEITLDLLETMGIPYEVIDRNSGEGGEALAKLIQRAQSDHGPVAIVVKKGTFDHYHRDPSIKEGSSSLLMSREEALGIILKNIPNDAAVVSTTGMPSREIFEYRENAGQGHEKDFLTVGSMGHCSQIAAGMAQELPEKTVICIDGDGALLMHMGSMAIIGQSGLKNYHHIVVNNGKHDSVGGQLTVALEIDLPAIATACGYAAAQRVSSQEELREAVQGFSSIDGPIFLEVQVRGGARSDLGRPTTTPVQNKEALMKFLGSA